GGLVVGKGWPRASWWGETPTARKNAIVTPTGNARSTRRMKGRGPPQKSRSVTDAFVTLQRAPPLTRIFAPGRRARSRRTTERDRLRGRVKIAGARPGAPAPAIATAHGVGTQPATLSSALPGGRGAAGVAGECAQQRVQRLIVARVLDFAHRHGGDRNRQVLDVVVGDLGEQLDAVDRQRRILFGCLRDGDNGFRGRGKAFGRPVQNTPPRLR